MRRNAPIVLALLLAASAVRADYQDSYAKGIVAIDNKNWAEAVRWLRQAATENPKEGGRVKIYGMRYKDYLPHYYLALAYSSSGDCSSALTELAESEKQGVVRGAAEFRDLQQIRTRCEGLVAKSAPTAAPAPRATEPSVVVAERPTPRPVGPSLEDATRTAQTELRRTEDAATAVNALKADAVGRSLWARDADLAGRERQASRTLETARRDIEAARRTNDLKLFESGGRTASQAREEYEAVRQLALQRRAAATQQAEAPPPTPARTPTPAISQAQLDLAKQVQESRQLLATGGRPAAGPLPPELVTARKDLDTLLREAERPGQSLTPQTATSLRVRIANATASVRALASRPPLPTAVPGPPDALLAAAGAYFRGDYAAAAGDLAQAQFSDPKANAQARLFRAAARYGLFVLGGERDQALRNGAVNDIRECARLNPGLKPSATAFSPRFAEFYEKSKG